MASYNIFEGYPSELLNRSTTSLKQNDFYVSFLNFSNNLSNILGRQVKSVKPVRLSNETIDRSKNKSTYPHQGRYNIESLSITFRADSFGIVMDVLFRQYLRQNNLLEDEDPINKNFRFDIKLEYYSAFGQSNQRMIYKDCFLEDLDFNEMTPTDDQPVEITAKFQVDAIDVQLKEWD